MYFVVVVFGTLSSVLPLGIVAKSTLDSNKQQFAAVWSVTPSKAAADPPPDTSALQIAVEPARSRAMRFPNPVILPHVQIARVGSEAHELRSVPGCALLFFNDTQ